MKILVTGATGLIGRRLGEYLSHFPEIEIIALTRKKVVSSYQNVTYLQMDFEQQEFLKGVQNPFASVDCFIHLAGRAHHFEKNDYSKHFEDNFLLTKKMADLARANGVRKFLYISTLKVPPVDTTHWGYEEYYQSVKEGDCYGLSKKMAEDYLGAINDPNFSTIVIRPPLVYGPEARANFRGLVKLCERPLPLPFRNVRNSRSFIFIDNLVYFIKECLDLACVRSGHRVYEISDGENVSTSRLVSTIRTSLGKNDMQFAVPDKMVRTFLKLLHREELYDKLWGDLVVDSKNFTEDFSALKLPYTFDQGIKITLEKMKRGVSAALLS